MLTCKAHIMVFITCTYGLLNSGTDLPTVISIVETLSVDNIYYYWVQLAEIHNSMYLSTSHICIYIYAPFL